MSSKIRATLSELWTRVIKPFSSDDIYANGEDNLYPNSIERVALNSPTASSAVSIMSKFIAGQGVRGENFVTNKKKNEKINDLIKPISKDIAIQNGCFVHVGYGFEGSSGKIVPVKLTALDYLKCRKSKEDDEDNEGKIYVKNWEESVTRFKSLAEKNVKWYYPFNNREEVIIQQIKADAAGKNVKDGDISKMLPFYRGQVFYLNLTPRFVYAISKFDSVYNDCDTEYRMSLYSNTMTRNGFLGKIAVLTQGLDEEKAEDVVTDIRDWLGAENSQKLYHLDVEESEDLDNVLKIIQVESQYDDDMFNNTDKRLVRNITSAANNIPQALIYNTEGALFGSSGEAYIQMKEFYNEQTKGERQAIEGMFAKLGFEIEIIPLIEDDEETEEKEEEQETEEQEDEIQNPPNPNQENEPF